MYTRKAFAARLVEERQEAHLTQAELAEKLDISRQTITQYERQIRVPDIEMIRKFAEFFGVSTDYLIGLSDYKTIETDAIGKKLGLSDESIAILQEASQTLKSMETWETMDKLGIISISEEYAKIDKIGNHFTELYAYLYLKSINSICKDRLLVKYIGDYLFKLIPFYMPGHDCDEVLQSSEGNILLQRNEVCEMGQAVNMYQIQKRLIELAEKNEKQ